MKFLKTRALNITILGLLNNCCVLFFTKIMNLNEAFKICII